MNNLYSFINIKNGLLLMFLIGLNFEKSFSQEMVTWNNAVVNNTSINGTAPLSGVYVTVNSSGVNGNYWFQPSSTNVFQGTGSWASGVVSDNLTFTFSQPVIITRFTLLDVNSGSNFSDSFNIINAGFANSNPNNAYISPNGASIPVGQGIGFTQVDFTCSNPLQNFGMQFVLTSGVSTAYLFYRIELIRLPEIQPICLKSLPPGFPIIGNGIVGTWSPSNIDTSVPGDFVYTFTPNAGQSITCSIPLNVTILPANASNCCVSQITLTSPGDNVSNITTPVSLIHREASDWIKASNLITVGNNNFQNGVVYHAGDFVELNPGFEALSGSQFSAYIQLCSGNYLYKNGADEEKEIVFENIPNNLIKNKISVYPNPTSGLLNVSLSNSKIKKILLTSIEGKVYVFEQFDNSENVVLDLSNYANGIYLMNVETDQGEIINSKVIKN